ncbi:MAG: zinc metalloprotease HtpX [Candidatus Aenigmatarchaeota archaeon]
MIALFDPLALVLAFFGYFLMFFLAGYVAPRVAYKLSGRFSLYTSMILLAALIIFSFSGTLFLIFYFLNYYYNFGITEFSSLMLQIIILVIVSNVILYVFSPLLINWMYGVKEDKRVQKIVDKVAKKLNYRGKLKGVITTNFSLPNAFAYGNFIFGKYVAISSGMLNLVNTKELEAVIGHEIGHHMHKDNVIMLLFGFLPSIIYFLGYSLIRSFSSSNNNEDSKANVILLIIGILAVAISFVIQILVLAFSRLREYFADLEGAKAAGKENMQSSLAKIHYYYEANLDSLNEIRESNTRMLFIYAFTQTFANPFENLDNIFFEDSSEESEDNKEERKSEKTKTKINVDRNKIEELKKLKVSPFEEFLSTHPPIPKRLNFLDSLNF